RNRPFPHIDICKICDDLRLAVLAHFEIFRPQIGYRSSIAVGNYRIHLYKIDIDSNDAVLSRRLPGRRLRRDAPRENKYDDAYDPIGFHKQTASREPTVARALSSTRFRDAMKDHAGGCGKTPKSL